MPPFHLAARGRYSLAAQAAFLRGFAPALYEGGDGAAIELAFPVERGWKTAGIRVTTENGGVRVDSSGRPPAHLEEQVQRMLSLDVDGTGYAAVGQRDPKIAALQESSGWLRPISFPSPYEAAVSRKLIGLSKIARSVASA